MKMSHRPRPLVAFAATVALAALAGPAGAQMGSPTQPPPQPLPYPATIAEPRDVAAPGVVKLAVDATDLDHRIFRVRESVPARPGPMTLLYPQWLPGNHSPTGPIDALAGLVISAGGQRLEWTRDPVQMYAFHVDVPAGATQLDLEFQYLSPVETKEGRVVMTPAMLNLQWNAVLLYPAGYFARRIPFSPSVKLPAGWKFATALDGATTTGDVTSFAQVDLDTLVDSPMYAGINYKRIDLDPSGATQVHLNVFADKPEQLEAKPEQIKAHVDLVKQAYRLHGAHHYDHYDFLLALSDKLSGIGLEHHRSSENGYDPGYFTEWDKTGAGRDLLSHEYTHSWDGKFRRPADLWTPNFNVPMRDSLLWVYEGQTQFWGEVLAARSGLWTKAQALDALAEDAASLDVQPGRAWRAMQDTTNGPILSQRRPLAWRDWQRSEDYYVEGLLIWFDADTLIREKSGGKRSLDDFAHAFYGVDNGSYTPLTYTFDDVVATLNKVEPYDWAGFLRTRLDGHGPGAPLDWVKRSGYRLVYDDKPGDFQKESEGKRGTSLYYSLGLTLGKDGAISGVRWDGPAFKAGVTAGWQVMAVNNTAYSADAIKDAVKAAKGTTAPIELILKYGDAFKTVRVDYHDGLRYPHLVKEAAGPSSLDAILAPRK